MSLSLLSRLRDWNLKRLRAHRHRRAAGCGESQDYAHWVERHDTIDAEQREQLRQRGARLCVRPLISVLMPVHDPEPAWLDEAISSVRAQLYEHWELCIADDCSTDPRIRAVLLRHADDDARIRIVWREHNGHISAATNSALDIARGHYVALLDHDDRLAEHALLCIAETLGHFPDAEILYSDEDKLDAGGHRCDPYFKCDWNLELFRGQNLISHLGVFRTALVRRVGGFRLGYEGSQDYDLALRCVEQVAPGNIVHIPHVLYHWRLHPRSTSQGGSAKPYARIAGQRALQDHFTRLGIACDVEGGEAGWHTCRYAMPSPAPSVSVLVVDSAGPRQLRSCLAALQSTAYPALEQVVVFASQSQGLVDACNDAIAAATGEVIAIIDSRCRFHSDDWLQRLVAYACLSGGGAIGAKLLSKRGRVVGNGVLIGAGGTFSPVAFGTRAHRGGYFGRARLAQHIVALGDGCVVVRRDHLRRPGVGWLDPSYRDMGAALVDLTFRLNAYGLRNIWTPLVEATLSPQGACARAIATRDAQRVARRWGFAGLRDAHYNDNLGLTAGRFQLASAPRVSLSRPWFETTR
jgi:glycosyltransferase involved in cell wall biosynthesis